MFDIKVHHPKYVLVGGDFSQLEVKTAVYTSKDEKMKEAYESGKDLYSLIGSMAYNLPYEQCLEFYPEGTEIEIEGKKIICGNEKTYEVESVDNTFTIPYFRLVNTSKGMVQASLLEPGDVLITDEKDVPIINVETKNNLTIITV